MIPITASPALSMPPSAAQSGAKPAAVLPSAPAPAALAAPAMTVRVDWAGAVRPPDAAARSARAELVAAAIADGLIGPPPSFSANLLDQIPEPPQPPELLAAEDPDAAPDQPAEGAAAAVSAPLAGADTAEDTQAPEAPEAPEAAEAAADPDGGTGTPTLSGYSLASAAPSGLDLSV